MSIDIEPTYLAVAIPSRETSSTKAMRYVATGRLRVLSVHAGRVWAECRGDGDVYSLGFAHGRWHCSCPARTVGCAHLRALRLVVDRPDSPGPNAAPALVVHERSSVNGPQSSQPKAGGPGFNDNRQGAPT